MGGSFSKKEGTNASTSQQYTTPTGLYSSCAWDLRTIRRLILAKKIAPIYPGKEENQIGNGDGPFTEADYEECPICFLYYPGGLNRSICCKKGICTECFFQIKKPSTPASCPFCNRENFSVVFSGPLSREEKDKEAQEEQKVLEAKIRMRSEEIERDTEREKRRLSLPANSHTLRKPAPDQNYENVAQSLPRDMERLNEREKERATIVLPPQRGVSQPDLDLEEMLLNEAIRLSLMESPPSSLPNNTSATITSQQQRTEQNKKEESELHIMESVDNEQSSSQQQQQQEQPSSSNNDHLQERKSHDSFSHESPILSHKADSTTHSVDDDDDDELREMELAISISLGQNP